MHQSPLTILTTNDSTLPITNHNVNQRITTVILISTGHLTLKVTSAQDVETSVTTNSPSQDSSHPDNQIPSNYVSPGFTPFSLDYYQQAVKFSQVQIIK